MPLGYVADESGGPASWAFTIDRLLVSYNPTRLIVAYDMGGDWVTLAEIVRQGATSARDITEDVSAVYFVRGLDYNTEAGRVVDEPREPDKDREKAWREVGETGFEGIDKYSTDALCCQIRVRSNRRRSMPVLQFFVPGKFHGLMSLLGGPADRALPAINFAIADLMGANINPAIVTKSVPGTSYIGTAGFLGFGAIKPENLVLLDEAKGNEDLLRLAPIITRGVMVRAFNPQAKVDTDWYISPTLTLTFGRWVIRLCHDGKDVGVIQPPPEELQGGE